MTALFLLFAGLTSAVIRFQQPTSTSSGYLGSGDYITNTNGKSYVCARTGLMQAIWDLNTSTHGTVFIPDTLTITGTITVDTGASRHIKLDFQGNSVVINADVDGFTMKRYASVKNAHVKVAASVAPYTHAVFLFRDADTFAASDAPYIENVEIENLDSPGINGTGISLVADTVGNNITGMVAAHNFQIRRFRYGIRLQAVESTATEYIKGVTFSNGWIEYCKYGICLNETGPNAEINSNIFDNYFVQPYGADPQLSHTGVHVSGDSNMFNGHVFDNTYFTYTGYHINKSATGNTVEDEFDGIRWIVDDSRNESSYNYTGNRVNGQYVPTMPCYPSDDNLTLYLSFSEGVGWQAYDRSVERNDGVLKGNMSGHSWTEGVNRGYALQFNGVNHDYVYCGANRSLFATDEFTVMAWVNQTSDNSVSQYVISSSAGVDAGYHIRIIDGIVNFYYNPAGTKYTLAAGTYKLPPGTWHHIAATYKSSSEAYLYIDGHCVDNTVATNVIATGFEGVYVGCFYSGTGASYFNGTIDEVRMYNRSMTFDEIQMQYLGGVQSSGYIRSNNFTVFDTNWHEYMRIPTTNETQYLQPGQCWFNTTTGDLGFFDGVKWVWFEHDNG